MIFLQLAQGKNGYFNVGDRCERLKFIGDITLITKFCHKFDIADDLFVSSKISVVYRRKCIFGLNVPHVPLRLSNGYIVKHVLQL